MGTMNSAFQLTDVSFSYSGHPVLEHVTIDIRESAFTVLFGRNGSGKSTLLRLMARLITGYYGSIRFHEKELNGCDHREFSKSVGYLGQHHRPVFPFSVEEVILTGRAGHVNFLPSVKDHEAVDAIMSELELQPLRTSLYTKLSGGEQQMVLLARALVNKPSILLLDEPTNHLDFTHQMQMMKFLRSLVEQRKMTVISAIHDPNTAFQFSDDILFVYDHHIMRDDTVEPWNSPLLKRIIPSFAKVTEKNITLIIPK
ncbi:MAG: ABC transporter ATP-binding protein [Bacteroidota bacterium]